MNNRVFQIQCPLFRYAVDKQGTQYLAQQFSRTILHGDGQWRISCKEFSDEGDAIDWCQDKHDKLKDTMEALPRVVDAIKKRKEAT